MKMFKTTPLYASWSSGIYTCGRSSTDLSADTDSCSPDRILPNSRPQKEVTQKKDQKTSEDFAVSRHNPMKTFRRESVIASWKSLKKEREQALGKKYVVIPNTEDYYGRRKVKRTKSERTTLTDTPRKKVKRTLSVVYRYDPDAEKVVKEYKYLRSSLKKRPFDQTESITNNTILMKKSFSEPSLLMLSQEEKPRNKIKRSLTTLLNLKSKFLNIFTSKS